MYTHLEYPFEGEIFCNRCEDVSQLEAQIVEIYRQLSTPRINGSLENGVPNIHRQNIRSQSEKGLVGRVLELLVVNWHTLINMFDWMR